MSAVFAVDACRTPVGKIKGALAGVRPDHLTADVIRALVARNPWLDPATIDDVYWGAANQAGEDNRNVARMGVLLAGLAEEIIPVTVPGAGQATADEGIRPDLTLDDLAARKPAFRENGTVTGGNSSPLNDGSAGVLLMSERAAAAAGIRPIARYAGAAAAGVHPDYMGIGPVPAMTRALARAGWRVDDLGLVEVNEAFAAQAVAVIEELKLDPELVNVNGGAIAIGHPLGCSGARITTTLLHEIRRRAAPRAAATMCIGVGQGIATLWEAA